MVVSSESSTWAGFFSVFVGSTRTVTLDYDAFMEPIPTVPANTLAWLTTDDMIEVDRVMIEDLDIQLKQMMENAGRSLAWLAIRLWNPGTVSVFVGPGGNGGGGLVAARHLHTTGRRVEVVRATESFAPVPADQFAIVERLGIPIVDEPSEDAEALLDAMLGYSLRGAPRSPMAELIDSINASDAKTLSLDAPSGLDTASGLTPGNVVMADATMTLAMPKQGLTEHAAVGDLYLANISVPTSVYTEMGFDVGSPFGDGPIVRVER